MNTPIKTILADDHKLFCDGLEKVLMESGRFQVIAKFNNGQSFLEKFNTLNPDLLIMDVEMPGLNGFDTVKRIKLYNPSVTIAMLSMHEQYVYSHEAFMLGTNAYLNKSMESVQLIEALIKICSGEKVFPKDINTTPKLETPFSDREYEILRMVSAGKTSDQIATRLKISPLTVKVHRRNMMRKLNVHNAAELISKALEMGFLYRSS